MIIKPYTTESLLESFLGIDIPAGDADNAINSAVQVIDNITGRNFIADAIATTRVYDSQGGLELVIDDCVEITQVERGLDMYGDSFEIIPSTGLMRYYTYPSNNSSKGVPITSILLRNYYWVRGIQNQRITAKWGYSKDVPPAIQQATNILAAGMYMYNKGGSSGSVTSEKIGNYAVSYGNDGEWKAYRNAIKTLEQYKKYSL